MRTRVPRDDEYIECIEFSVSTTTTTTTFGAEERQSRWPFGFRTWERGDRDQNEEQRARTTRGEEEGRRWRVREWENHESSELE